MQGSMPCVAPDESSRRRRWRAKLDRRDRAYRVVFAYKKLSRRTAVDARREPRMIQTGERLYGLAGEGSLVQLC